VTPLDLVGLTIEQGVARLYLNDPDRRNALSADMSAALAERVAEATGQGVGAIVLTAAPPVFCSGGLLESLLSPEVPLERTYDGFRALARVAVPTIAAIGGPVVGAGVNLALACDVVVATPAARFDPRFLDVGIHPGGGHLWRLRRRIGSQGAAAMVLCGDVLTGEEAVVRGLAWRCVEPGVLEEVAMALAVRAAGRPRELVVRAKETLRASEGTPGADEAEALELAAQRWSMELPQFEERVRAVQARLSARRSG
jgi:enoyl-CoA hydratase